jgi:hypothetical protein
VMCSSSVACPWKCGLHHCYCYTSSPNALKFLY